MLNLEKSAGIITLVNWTMMPNGARYLYIWCRKWIIYTDKQIPVDGFRSSEHWQLAGMIGDTVMVFIPGCQVKGWCRCDNPPFVPENNVYIIGE